MQSGREIRPDFIVIGAMKCGTTTLARMLSTHPAIGMSRDKETDFFVSEKNYTRGRQWYTEQFDPAFPVHGEASPNYTKIRDFPGVPWRIRDHCPDVKLIFIARDPVERAKAQFRHVSLMGTYKGRPEDLGGSHEYHHIMDASHYARQIEPYLEVFDRDRLLILDLDELRADPQTVMNEVHAFLGVEPHEIPKSGAHNSSQELSRIPPFALRLAQSPLGRTMTKVVGRGGRDRVRRLLAFGKQREVAAFPPELESQMRDELSADAAAFRQIAGKPFATWSV